MSRLSGITGVILLVASIVTAQTNPVPTATAAQKSAPLQSVGSETAIRTELEAQMAAWNRGDLKGFMRGYWNSPELTFFAGSKESRGWEAAYQRYRTGYVGRDKQMGTLSFTNIRVEELAPEAAFARGDWQLTMKDGSQRHGLFTVVLKKFSDGWRIIHDHSS